MKNNMEKSLINAGEEEDKIQKGVKIVFSDASRLKEPGNKKPSLSEQDGDYGDDENPNNPNLEEEKEEKEEK